MQLLNITMNTNKLVKTKYDIYVRNSCNECVNELTMYHITTKDNAINILDI